METKEIKRTKTKEEIDEILNNNGLVFFVKVLMYIAKNTEELLPSKKKSKDTIGIGYENAISKLCGIMKTPVSLREFYNQINRELISFSA